MSEEKTAPTMQESLTAYLEALNGGKHKQALAQLEQLKKTVNQNYRTLSRVVNFDVGNLT